MSRQVKLKFKKLLKKAEFVHADLEYHQELFPDAQGEFFVAVNDIFDSLPPEIQKELQQLRSQRLKAEAHREESNREEEETSDEEESDNTEVLVTPDGPDLDVPGTECDEEDPGIKSAEAKKLFYKIAEVTHPDKLLNRQLSPNESQRLERLFIRATGAYNSLNWYVLYSIALELGIEVGTPREEYLEWVEDDIRRTMGAIAEIGSKIIWVWYTGDEVSKRFAIENYFQQVYNYTLEE